MKTICTTSHKWPLLATGLHIKQNVVENWPFYIEGHHYRVHHVLLESGELILFEGARLAHGRPKALQGSSYSDVIVHFRLKTRE